jgi:hypothetical protein
VASFRPPLGSPIQHPLDVTHYRIITPAKPPEPEMPYTPYALPEGATLSDWIPHDGGKCPVSESALVHVDIPGLNLAPAPAAGFPWNRVKRYCTVDIKPPKPEPDLITLRLECLKLAGKAIHVSDPDDWTEFADALLHYVLNGSVDKA